MTKNRRKFTAEQKAEIVRRHLKDKTPISMLAEELSLQPTQIYQWVALALEQLGKLFAKNENGRAASSKATRKIAELKEQKIKRLEAKLVDKNEVIAELMEENLKAKKANGDL
jgi:transposase-like protein